MLMRLTATDSGDITPEKQAIAEILTTLIEAYEEGSARASTPLSVLRELMAANDLKQENYCAVHRRKASLPKSSAVDKFALIRRPNTRQHRVDGQRRGDLGADRDRSALIRSKDRNTSTAQ